MITLVAIALYSSGLWAKITRALREAGEEQIRARRSAYSASGDGDLSYRILGVSPSASWDEIERAYRAKAKAYHPDHGGDEHMMCLLNEAYARLKRDRRR